MYLADLTIEQLNALTLEELNTLGLNAPAEQRYGHTPWLLKDMEVFSSLWFLNDTELYA